MSTPTPKEIRDAFQDYRSEWQPIRDEAAKDMQAISPEGPWSQEDKEARKGSGRPCIHLDQLNQFLSQVNGNMRKSPRAIKAIPKGEGANDQDAGKRSSLIMAIEDRSQAQQIYLSTAQCMLERSYGFARVCTEYKDDDSFDQEILIKPILNPDTVLLSPYYKQPSGSDVEDGFLLDLIPKKSFENKYPKADITDFSDDLQSEVGVSDWIKEKYVQIAEFWKIHQKRSKLFLVQLSEDWPPEIFTEADWKKAKELGLRGQIKRERDVETPYVMQYMTNGLEILDEVPWAGTRIPIISCLGPERWTTEGGTAKRQLLSMVRFARDPQMLFDYITSGECEVAGRIPKIPFVGAKGQFESDKDAWDELTKVPHAYVQYDIVLDSGGQPVGPPVYSDFTPNFQEWEVAKDSVGRSIQSAMGLSFMPDAAQRRGQKSGVALEKIDDMESLGAVQFIDRFENGFLHNMGWQINELITPIIDTQREMPVSKPDGKRSTMQLVGNTSHPINEQGAYEVQGLDQDHMHTGLGEFDVTISTGPSYDSEREEQSDFVNQLIENIANLPQPGTPAAKVMALGIRMRPTLGPIGQQIADVFDPPDPSNLPPEAQAIVSQLQGQIQQLTQENQALHMDRAGRVLEQQTKLQIEGMRGKTSMDSKTVDFITQIVKAELAAKSKALDTQAQSDADKELAMLGFNQDHHLQAQGQAHEVGLEATKHANAKELADKQAQVASQQQVSDQSHQQAMAEQQPAAE